MVYHIFLLAGSFLSLNLVELTNPECKNRSECLDQEFQSCCDGVCNEWKYCNGSCATGSDCALEELCVDRLCSSNELNAAQNSTKPVLNHIRLKDYLICIGFVMCLFLFQLGLPLVYIYKDRVAFCLKCKCLWSKETIEEDENPPEETSRINWRYFSCNRGFSTAAQYSRLAQLDDSCSYESEVYSDARDREQNLNMVQRQCEIAFGVPPPMYTSQVALEIEGDTSDPPVTTSSTSDPPADDSNGNDNEQSSEPQLNPEIDSLSVHSDDEPDGIQEIPTTDDSTRMAEYGFTIALSIPPPYERACFTRPDDETDGAQLYSPANEVTDNEHVESSLKKLYKLPSYNSLNKMTEDTDSLPPSYIDVVED